MNRLNKNHERSWAVLEFGVAWGYATEWWLSSIADPNLSWHGFDRFTGLPRGWRGLAKGAFDAGGAPPNLVDARVTWHIGDVEDTLTDRLISSLDDQPLLVLFDLDIYEPTAVVWHRLEPVLKPGDLVYFDEAMDEDERRVLDDFVLPSERVRYLGGTASAIAFEVIG
jgi:predicted O-methyltransferase YrrM